jgi:hypothetical protein
VQCLAYLRRDAGGNKKKKKKPTTTHLHKTQKCLTNANFLLSAKHNKNNQ